MAAELPPGYRARDSERWLPETHSNPRSDFARDRGRLLHSSALRRLSQKTQVLSPTQGLDFARNRLTHSLEVAQVGRELATNLGLDPDVVDTACLAHDLGHPPFGHAGERALDRAMREWGGFDHNAHSLRIVTQLERKYARFDGLNLTFETLEGLAKHNGPLLGVHARPGADEASAELVGLVRTLGLDHALALDRFAPAEAQVAAIADDIAYTNHDIDDGLRAGLLTLGDLASAPMAGAFVNDALAASDIDRSDPSSAGERGRRLFYEVNRRMITAMIDDVVTETRTRIAGLAPRNADDIRNASAPVVSFSPSQKAALEGLRAFLFQRVYRSDPIMRVMNKAEQVVAELFAHYMADAASLPGGRGGTLSGLEPAARARFIANFIAGMTDRFALAEYARLFDEPIDLH